MNKQLVLIRLIAVIGMIVSFFGIGWYIYSRYNQIVSYNSASVNTELNAPRINKGSLNKLEEDLKERKEYNFNSKIEFKINEADPFYGVASEDIEEEVEE